MEASFGGHIDVVRTLIELQADVHSQDLVKYTELHVYVMTVYS